MVSTKKVQCGWGLPAYLQSQAYGEGGCKSKELDQEAVDTVPWEKCLPYNHEDPSSAGETEMGGSGGCPAELVYLDW